MTRRNRSVISDSPICVDGFPLPASFLTTLDDPVIILDHEGRIKAVNDTCRRNFARLDGFPDDDLLDRSYPEVLSAATDELPEDVIEGIRSVLSGERDRYQGVIPDTSPDCQIQLEAFTAEGNHYATVFHVPLEGAEATKESNDPSCPEKTSTPSESSLETRGPITSGSDTTGLLRELHQTTRDLMRAETQDQVAQTAAEIIDEYFEYATVGVRLLKEEKLVMTAVEVSDERVEGREPPAYDIGEGFVGETFQGGEARIFDDLQEAARDLDFDYSPMKSAMIIPLGDYGVISVASDELAAFGGTDLELGRQFAADVESALERAKREEKLRERELELRRTTVGKNYLQSILDTLPAGLLISDTEGRVKTVNNTLEQMLGYEENQLVDRETRVIFNDGLETVQQRIEMIQDMGPPLYEDTEFITRDGETIPVFLTGDELEQGEDGEPELVWVGIDITELKLKNRQLRDNKRRLSLAINAARAGVWEWDLTNNEVFWDKNTEELFGLETGEFDQTYQAFLDFVHEDDLPTIREATQEAVENDEVYEEEFRIETVDGETRWLLSRGEVYTDLEGNPENMIGATVDITDRKETQEALEGALEEKETLLREIHHRVKNNMQIIKSLLSMQIRNLESEELNQAFQESMSRVQTMAMVHENLYQSENLASVNFRQYLRNVCNNLLNTHGVKKSVSVKLDVEDREMSMDRSIACGLIVNELVTNSLEHGFDSQSGGEIEICFECLQDGRMKLRVADDGQGVDGSFDLQSMGSTGFDIVQSLADYELGGTVDYEGNDGFTVTVVFDQ